MKLLMGLWSISSQSDPDDKISQLGQIPLNPNSSLCYVYLNISLSLEEVKPKMRATQKMNAITLNPQPLKL